MGPSLPPRRSRRPFRGGCSIASHGHGSSSASFPWRWRPPGSCCSQIARRSSRPRAVRSTGSASLLSPSTLFCFTYVFSQGSRWDWFEEPRIVWLTVAGAAALLAFLGQQVVANGRRPARLHLVAVRRFLLRLHRQLCRRRRLVRECVPDSVVCRVRPRVYAYRCRPALVAERRAFRRRAPHCRVPHAGPPPSSGCHSAFWNPDDHGCDVDAVRLDQRKRRG